MKRLGINVGYLMFGLLAWPLMAVPAVAQLSSTSEVIETEAFRIHISFDNQEVATQVKSIAEATWKITSEIYGASLPQEKLNVYLYRTSQEYEKAEEKLTKGRFKRNLAFAHYATKSAHVAIQPAASDKLLVAVGLPKQTARLLAHEMAHLTRYNHMPHSYADHPDWLADGIASYINQQVLLDRGLVDDLMKDPNYATYPVEVRRVLAEEKLPSVSELMDDVPMDVGFNEQYSVRWALVHFLFTSKKTKFTKFVRDLRRLGGGPNFVQRTKKFLLEHLDTDLDTLDREFRKYVAKFQPQWIEESGVLETSGPTWDQIAFLDSTACAWRQAPLKGSFSVSSTATIRDRGGKQLNIRIGERDAFTQFSITADYGLNIFVFADNNWKMKQAKEIPGIVVEKPLTFSISHRGESDETTVTINGVKAFQGKLEVLAGSLVGLSAQTGSAIRWENFETR